MRVFVLFLCFFSLVFGELKAQDWPSYLVGTWKLKQSGFFENNKEVIKEFDDCRLSRNFVFNNDGTVTYNYYEGNTTNCYKHLPEIYSWKVENDILILRMGEYFGYYKISLIKADILRISSLPKKTDSTIDSLSNHILSTIHFDDYSRSDTSVTCENCLQVTAVDY